MHVCDGKCGCGSTVGREIVIELRDRDIRVLSCVLCERVRFHSWRQSRATKRDKVALERYNRGIERTEQRRERARR